MDGRNCDVLIEPYPMMDMQTGVKYFADDEFIVWADRGVDNIIRAVAGVYSVSHFDGTEYFVKIDKRYDMKYVQDEVKAAILCREIKS